MKKQKKKSMAFVARRIVDAAMTVMIVLLLASQITGRLAHEWAGIVLFVLVVIHMAMNRAWYKNIFKGKHPPARVFQMTVDLALLACFMITAVSGMLMSSYAVPFLRINSAVGGARTLHLAFSHWTYVLISAHIGLHWGLMVRGLREKKALWAVLSIAAVCAAGYGLLLSVRAQIYTYMFFRVQFAFMDYGKPAAQVFAENLLMMSSWILISYEITRMLAKPAAKDPHRRAVSFGMIAAEFALAGLFSLIVPASV